MRGFCYRIQGTNDQYVFLKNLFYQPFLQTLLFTVFSLEIITDGHVKFSVVNLSVKWFDDKGNNVKSKNVSRMNFTIFNYKKYKFKLLICQSSR